MPRYSVLDCKWFRLMFQRFIDTYASFWNVIIANFIAMPMNDKVEYIYKLWHQIDLFSVRPITFPKSTSEARHYEHLSGAFFDDREYKDAAAFATKMLAYAPKTENNLLITAYNLRSRALFAQRKYVLALTDINRCLDLYDVSDHRDREELRDRQAECLQLIHKDASNRVRNLARRFEGSPSDRSSSALVISTNPRFTNERLPGASEKITLRYLEDARSTRIVATEEIQPGELLMCAEPYVSKLFPDKFFTHCSHCHVRCEILIPCDNCPRNMYCSTTCLANDRDSVHTSFECDISQFLQPLDEQNLDSLALRVFLKATRQGSGLYSLLRHRVYGNPFVRLGISPHLPFRSEHYNSVHELEDNFANFMSFGKFTLLPHILQVEWVSMAAVYLNVLIESNYFQLTRIYHPEVCDPQEFGLSVAEKFAGTLLLKYLCIVRCNSHFIMETPSGSRYWTDRIRIGVALYTLPSLMTHSCDSLVIRDNSYRNRMYFFAGQRILEGDQITDDYGVQYFDTISVDRQHFLNNFRWHLQCKCDACKGDWLPVNELVERYLPIRSTLELDSRQRLELRMEYNACLRILNTFTGSDNGIDQYWDFFCQYLRMWHPLIIKPFRQYTECQISLRKIVYRRRQITDEELPA